ncbi:MAG: hypothetical protein WBP03_01855 [Candidatus Saccharimonadales bacterium]|jgi:hypothetical protein
MNFVIWLAFIFHIAAYNYRNNARERIPAMHPEQPLPSNVPVLNDSFVPDPSQLPVQPLTAQQSTQALKSAIRDSGEIMAKASTIFPFTLFPDTLSIDRAKVTVAKRFFFRVAETTSFRIEDILSASSAVGPFFGSVKIITRVMNKEQETEIGPFWREDAERMKRIVHGYIIAKQRAIDTSQLNTQHLAHLLDELGQDNRS